MLVKAIGIFSVATVGGPTAGLYVCHAVGVWTEYAEECLGVHGPSANLYVVGLLENAVTIRPEFLQLKKKVLKGRAFDDVLFLF